MNCGHDEDPVEMFTRSALAMKSKPTVIYQLSGTPFWTPADCENISATAKRPPKSAQEKQILHRLKKKNGLKVNAGNSSIMNSFTFLYHTSRSHDGIPSLYAEVAPMAQVGM